MPSYVLRLLALPCLSRTATQKPTHICNICVRKLSFTRHYAECMTSHTTGIYRCSILDSDRKFARHFRTSRISADKRFQNIYLIRNPKRITKQSLPLSPRIGASARRSAIAKLRQISESTKSNLKKMVYLVFYWLTTWI